MASSTLLDAVNTDTEGTGASVTGPCTIHISGSMGGGFIRIETSSTDGNYRTVHVQNHQEPHIIGATGAYYVRAVLKDSTSPSLTVKAVN